MPARNSILFFGYGANRDQDMIKAILGRKPHGEPATLSGFELCIQTWNEMNSPTQNILKNSWGKTFKSYVIRPAISAATSVRGMIWHITSKERKLIDFWELTGTWYLVSLLKLPHPDLGQITIELQIVNNPNIKNVSNGLHYRNFLNPKYKMLQTARKSRQLALRQLHLSSN